ncbi:MAG: hypothetical protein IIC78_00640 [Chloroflexi bacterium]|nr:hypothetical protein [Chloroflexota bacterium]
MKVQIVYLSASDDIDSTRDLLGWVQSPRALLVWPNRGRVLHRGLDLVLLKRYAQRRNLAVGLLTFDSEIRQRAAELGFSLFESLEELPEERWRLFREFDRVGEGARDSLQQPGVILARRERIPDWVQQLDRKPSRILLGALLLIIVVLSAAVIPSAEIILSPPKQLEYATFELALTGFDGRPGQLHAEIEQIRIQGSAVYRTTGSATFPISASRGSIIFTNLSPIMISIPRHLGIRPVGLQSLRFQTTSSGKLPAEIGAVIELPMEADDFGEQGNLPSGTIFSTEAAFGLMVAITNPNPIRGGSSEKRNSVSAADLAGLEEKLIQELFGRAENEIAVTIGIEQAVFEDSATVDRVFSQDFSHGEGEPTQQITLALDLNILVLVYRVNDLLSKIQEAITDELDSNRIVIKNSVQVTQVNYVASDDESIGVIRIQGSAESYTPLSQQTVLTPVRGRTPGAARDNLEELVPLERPPAFLLKPTWLPLLPWLNNRIDVLYVWEE